MHTSNRILLTRQQTQATDYKSTVNKEATCVYLNIRGMFVFALRASTSMNRFLEALNHPRPLIIIMMISHRASSPAAVERSGAALAFWGVGGGQLKPFQIKTTKTSGCLCHRINGYYGGGLPPAG